MNFRSLRYQLGVYPAQYWYLVFGMLISTTGMGLIWPFMTIYLRTRMGVPLTTVTSLLLLDSAMSILATFLAGSVSDRFGRKGVIVVSLFMTGLIYLVMSAATQLWMFAVLLALRGLFFPLYRIGADAMVADLVSNEQRTDAYSLLRMVNNVGVAVGPSLGGVITAFSYSIAFFIAFGCLAFFGVFTLILMKETLPKAARQVAATVSSSAGYATILRDRVFLWFVAALTLTGTGSSVVFALLGVYAKENLGMPENQTGLIMAVNGLMVILFQFGITQLTKRRRPLLVLALGSLFYAVGIGLMGLSQVFWQFALCMVILTIGELITAPTATSFTANLAPVEMRGRYMSFYWLAWGISHGLGPLLGGFFNDNIAPQAIWFGGAAWCVLAVVNYLLLIRWSKRREESFA